MSEDLPFTCEYAKSNRSSCKGCKEKIAQGVLRMGIMVQSPHFDGKMPNWYHNTCFWKKTRVGGEGDIKGFDALRWEDQEAVRKKIEGKSEVKKDSAPADDFKLERAKSNKSKCRVCEGTILKEEVRVSRTDRESKAGKMRGGVDAWHHLNCFAQKMADFGFTHNPAKIPGFDELNAEGQELVKKALKVKKRKAEDETEEEDRPGPSSKKKSKKEEKALDKEKEMLKAQSKDLWGIRDELSVLSKRELTSLLEENEQQVPSGNDKILDRLSDCMLFGPLEPCQECENGQFVFSTEKNAYKCTGHVTGFTRCEATQETPKRMKKFLVPEELKELAFFKKWKFKAGRQRLLPANKPAPTASQDTDGSSSGIKKAYRPLEGLKVVVSGDESFSKSKQELQDELRLLGAKVVATVSDSVSAVVGTKGEVEALKVAAMKNAKKFGAAVVDEAFVTAARDSKDAAVAQLIKDHSIAPWTPDNVADKIQAAQKAKSMKSGEGQWKSTKGSQKMVVKDGAAVDPDCEVADDTHVLRCKDGGHYLATLNLADVRSGANSYYKLQLLQHDTRKKYWIWRAWGRVGTTVGGTKLEEMDNKPDAKDEFCRLYLDKTGNDWSDRKDFEKQPNKFYPVEVDFGEEELPKSSVAAGSKSKLQPAVQNLIRLIFDVEQMKQAMKEFEIDLKKMPLGKLSTKQIKAAYSVLTELQDLIKNKASETLLVDGSNRFYTLIPHDFGMQKPKILDKEDLITEKTQMLDSLLEIEVAYSILKSESAEGQDPIDANYEKLKTVIKVMDKESEEYKRLVKYVHNTHATTHNMYTLQVEEIFKIEREGELDRYKKFAKLGNRMLLWHGSRTSNYAGILSQGLRIAPPEAPPTGYMFGKGIYFADMVSKSANYCHTSKQNPTGVLLLSEVALGDMLEFKQSHYVDKLPDGKHSTKGVGRTQPEPKETFITEDGTIIPLGKGVPSCGVGNTSLLYNEYIVYDVDQVNIQYLFRMTFKHKF